MNAQEVQEATQLFYRMNNLINRTRERKLREMTESDEVAHGEDYRAGFEAASKLLLIEARDIDVDELMAAVGS